MRTPTPLGCLVIGMALATSLTLPAAASTASPAPSTSPTTTTSIDPVIACSALVGKTPSATITSAAVVTDTSVGRPLSTCDVKGQFSSLGDVTQFELKLPPSGWQGQYVQEGCQDYCGALGTSLVPVGGYICPTAYNGLLATASDDEGHEDPNPLDASWAKNDLAARVVFGRTSEHVLAQVAKAVIAHYYGRPPAYSYFDGCSTGGREAMVLAQDYPDDFDGIIAGAPVDNQTAVELFAAWMVDHNTDAAGHQVLTEDKLPALHDAVLKACANSAGVIPDPRLCAFDPASIQCPAGTDTVDCLTPAQVAAVRAFYLGPTDEHGRSMIGGGEPYGSELGWGGSFVEPASDNAAPGDSMLATIALNFLQDMAFEPNPPAGLTLADIPFTDAELARLNVLGNAIYNANDPNLRAFAAHGGKLIMYHGWADQLITPFSTVDYYAAMERTMGGYRASQSFSRLYLVPGAQHCLFDQDYTQVNVADFLQAMTDWVQQGIAPGSLDAPTVSLADGSVLADQTISPVNALAPVDSPAGSLNGHYRLLPGLT